MVVEINENDCSVIRWSPNGKTDWKSANIDDLIHAYELKRGRWIQVEEDDDDIFLAYWCTKCRRTIYADADGRFVIGLTIRDMHFCPNCGAKMENEE